jgi:hypothetical protein
VSHFLSKCGLFVQCISQLAENNLLTAEMYPSITEHTRDRLQDKLVSVRKQALLTLEALITRNPFGNVLSYDLAFEAMETELRQLNTNSVKSRSVRRASMAAPKSTPQENEDAVGDACTGVPDKANMRMPVWFLVQCGACMQAWLL